MFTLFFLEAFDNGVSILNKLFWTMNSNKKKGKTTRTMVEKEDI